MPTPLPTDTFTVTRGGPPGGGGTPRSFPITIAQLVALVSSISGVSSITAGSGISINQSTGDVIISATGGSGGGNDYATATNNSGNTTITPTEPNYALGLTFGGSAGNRIIILDTAGRTAGDRIILDITFPATSGINVNVKNATSGGTDLLPSESFASNQFSTDGSILSAHWEFVFTGTAWRYETSNIPA